MKRHFAALFAAGALIIAVPTAASAQERGYFGQGQYYGGQYGSSEWNRNNRGYDNLQRQFQHAYDGIQHGLRDGSFNRREARDLDRQLARLHAVMHEAHESGHEEQDYGYGGRDDHRDRDYGSNRDGRGDHDHDRDDRDDRDDRR